MIDEPLKSVYILWYDDFVCEYRSIMGIFATRSRAQKSLDEYISDYDVEVEARNGRETIYRLTEKEEPQNYMGYVQLEERELL